MAVCPLNSNSPHLSSRSYLLCLFNGPFSGETFFLFLFLLNAAQTQDLNHRHWTNVHKCMLSHYPLFSLFLQSLTFFVPKYCFVLSLSVSFSFFFYFFLILSAIKHTRTHTHSTSLCRTSSKCLSRTHTHTSTRTCTKCIPLSSLSGNLLLWLSFGIVTLTLTGLGTLFFLLEKSIWIFVDWHLTKKRLEKSSSYRHHGGKER